MSFRRKDEHMKICLNEDVGSLYSTGLEEYRIRHNALPEIDMKDIDTSVTFLGKRLSAPLLISAMTGGTLLGKKVNISLARLAERLNIAMCVGSQRIALKKSVLGFNIRKYAPDILLFANIGAVQLNYGMKYEDCQRAVDMIQADALCLHVNPLQEALQPEGDVDFSGLLDKIKTIAMNISVPVIIKEVGLGISADVAKRLEKIGIHFIDVAGAGGTSFAVVESYRRGTRQRFREFGLPTAKSIVEINKQTSQTLIASGGIRTGMDVFKSLCLGASLSGIATPLFRAVNQGLEYDLMKRIIFELQVSMFSAGRSRIRDMCPGLLEKI